MPCVRAMWVRIRLAHSTRDQFGAALAWAKRMCSGWFAHDEDVGHELVADLRELVVVDELQDVLVGGVVLGG